MPKTIKMDSAWFNEVDSCRISLPTFRDTADPVSNRQRDSGVSSASLKDLDSPISVSTVHVKPAHQVTLEKYKNNFCGQRVAKSVDRIYEIAKEFDKLHIHKSHSTKEAESRRLATTGISSPSELRSDIPVLYSEINNNFHDKYNNVVLPKPTTVAPEIRSKPTTRTRNSSKSRPPSRDSGHSSGNSCHSEKTCKHYTYHYHQYGVTAPPQPYPQPQYYQVAAPVPPQPAKAHLPRQKAIEFEYEKPASRPNRKTRSTQHRSRQPSKPRNPTFEESLIDAISPGFADATTFSKFNQAIPDRVTLSDIVKLVKHNRYWFLADIIKDTLILTNVQNYVAELQIVLQQYVNMLKRDIRQYRNNPKYMDFTSERQEELEVCLEKVDHLQKIRHRDARGFQKLPGRDVSSGEKTRIFFRLRFQKTRIRDFGAGGSEG